MPRMASAYVAFGRRSGSSRATETPKATESSRELRFNLVPQRLHRHLELDVLLREFSQVRPHVLPVPRLVDTQLRRRVARQGSFNLRFVAARYDDFDPRRQRLELGREQRQHGLERVAGQLVERIYDQYEGVVRAAGRLDVLQRLGY